MKFVFQLIEDVVDVQLLHSLPDEFRTRTLAILRIDPLVVKLNEAFSAELSRIAYLKLEAMQICTDNIAAFRESTKLHFMLTDTM